MRFGLSSYWCSLFGLLNLETSKYWIPLIFVTKWSQKAKKIIIFSFFHSPAFKKTFSAFVGLFQYLMGFLVSCKAISTNQCQIFAKKMFLGLWYKFSQNLPECEILGDQIFNYLICRVDNNENVMPLAKLHQNMLSLMQAHCRPTLQVYS